MSDEATHHDLCLLAGMSKSIDAGMCDCDLIERAVDRERAAIEARIEERFKNQPPFKFTDNEYAILPGMARTTVHEALDSVWESARLEALEAVWEEKP